MAIEVIGAGFGRTGTLSLKLALETLGFDKCYHMMEVSLNLSHSKLWSRVAKGQSVDWAQLFTGYKASVDWPSSSFWREQYKAYPEARIILSLRDSDKWYESVMNTIWRASEKARLDAENSEDEEALARSTMVYEVIWNGVFDGRMGDKAHVIDCYEKHNQEVIDHVAADKLLVYRPGDGWEPLCNFLQQPIPEKDYPRVNSTDDFNRRWSK
jgi:hypothetical protein|tara:strand:- start:2851 stop:3486 length:636 start_codon:yes stop_codon:yes gene_type:complete